MARAGSGFNLGLFLIYPLCGLMVENFGWESGKVNYQRYNFYYFISLILANYLIGGITTLWFIPWCFLVYDSPSDHPNLSLKEKKRLEKILQQKTQLIRRPSVPWKSILTSKPFLGLILADFADLWGYYTLGLSLPTYLNAMMGVDIR